MDDISLFGEVREEKPRRKSRQSLDELHANAERACRADRGVSLSRRLDEICLKHHDMLPGDEEE